MTCVPHNHHRVLRNRHQDGCEGGACPGCEPCPEPHCRPSRRNHADTTCPACLNMARTNLTTIVHLHTRLAHEATNGRHALHVHTGIPGGDALVLLAPAATTTGHRAQLTHRHTHELDTTHTQDEYRGDPRPPLAVLLHWEHLWRTRHHHPTDLEPTLDRVADYLDSQLHKIADDPTFPVMAADLTHTVHRLEDVLHDGHRPETTRVPCWECGTRLVKEYADRESDDYWVCPRCGERYDRGRYDRAKHDHLASAGADRYVYVADAAAALGRSVKTVRTWVARELVDTRRDPKTGRLDVWWPDVRSLHLTRKAKS